MDADTRRTRAADAAALLKRLDAEGDSSVAMIEEYARRSRTSDPNLATALPLAALPRRLDAAVMAVLIGHPEMLDEGQRLLDQLADYPFVRPHPSGGMTYHDRVRDAVRQQRLADPGSPMADVSRRLSDHMLGAFDDARRLATELRIATSVLQEIQPARLKAIRTAVEWRLAIALKEAVYHAKDAGPDQVQALFLSRMGQIEAEPRLIEIALDEVRVARDAVVADPMSQGWLTYCQARLLRDLGQVREAESLLRELLETVAAESEDEQRLRHWAMGDLGMCLERLERFMDAEQVYAQDLALLRQHDDLDPWNLSAAYQRLAALQLRLENVSDAAGSFEQAAQAARVAENDVSLIYALLHEAEARERLGERPHAWRLAGEALHVSRGRPAWRIAQGSLPGEDVQVHQQVGLAFVRLLAPHDQLLVDTVVGEVEALTAGCGTQEDDLAAPVLLSEVLREQGAFGRARELLDQVRSMAAGLAVEPQRRVLTTLDFQATFLDRAAADFDLAAAQWGRILAGLEAASSPSPWDIAAARSNLGDALLSQGRLEDAKAVFDAARTTWAELGLRRYVALIDTGRAEVSLRQGLVDEAAEILESARPELVNEPTVLADDYHRVAGLVAAARGAPGEAAQLLRQRARSALDRADGPGAARALAQAAAHAATAGQWALARDCAVQAGELFERAGSMDAHRPDDLGRRVDQHTRAAVQLFFEGVDERTKDLEKARRHYGQALELQPHNSWLHVSRYYVCAEQDDRGEASRELGVIEASPDAELWAAWTAARRADEANTQVSHSGMARVSSSLADATAPLSWAARQVRRLLGGSTPR